MKWLKKQWDGFQAKSVWGKFWDILFIVVIILLIVPDGRLFVQRTLLKTGIMGNTEQNTFEAANSTVFNWKLRDLNGEIVTLGDLNDRSLFINFWATWCPPCRAEMPSIISLMEQAGSEANYLLITQEDPQKVKAFLASKYWDLPVYFLVTSTPTQLQAKSLPTTYVIDASGNIIHQSEGMRDWASEEAVRLVTGD